MPVSSASSPVDTAGSIATTIRTKSGIFRWTGQRVSSISARDQRAPGTSSKYLGVELLPAEPGALVLAYDLLQKRRREVGPIVVCRAARDHRGGVGDQLADDFDRLRRRGDDDARIRPKPQPEHQHVPRLWIPPGGYFITPRCIVLRSPQALRLVGAVGCRNGPVRPGQPALCRLQG